MNNSWIIYFNNLFLILVLKELIINFQFYEIAKDIKLRQVKRVIGITRKHIKMVNLLFAAFIISFYYSYLFIS